MNCKHNVEIDPVSGNFRCGLCKKRLNEIQALDILKEIMGDSGTRILWVLKQLQMGIKGKLTRSKCIEKIETLIDKRDNI